MTQHEERLLCTLATLPVFNTVVENTYRELALGVPGFDLERVTSAALAAGRALDKIELSKGELLAAALIVVSACIESVLTAPKTEEVRDAGPMPN